ncbi:GGDEF domain-containing protein [Kamptonema animale CS-326]|jgi:diguanylate cyclase (GGDEF)-like protein|uniref:GGDEF domain-containing protein n=1 Tax=Kamptonema animale TaxID=92934 RepID=UPI00232F797C|nr:GGDEF domain-containing protein [Kamptonema animale]MDB9511291.1 GGDEF domain-containing protein [Kamptonema animale CS-326]
MASTGFQHQSIFVNAQRLENRSKEPPSKEEILLEIEQLRQELQEIKAEKMQLDILLEAACARADAVEVLLHESHQQLQAEIAERERAQAAMKAAQAELQSVQANVSRDKADMELILETMREHGDLVENFLHDQCIRDPVTGLFNRRYLTEFLMREIEYSTQVQQPLSCIMLDIDYFKRFNDTFGHDAGDLVLQELSLFLQRYVYNSEIVCRYGGEEFILVLPESSLEEACQRAEQLRQGVKQLNVKYNGQSLDIITVSLGVACFPEHGKTGAEVIQAADVALYRAKAKGRDRVASARSRF